MSVCQTITFESFDVRSSYLHNLVYPKRIQVRFVYEGHRIKVKVTGAKMVENAYSRNVKIRVAINSPSIKHGATRFACIIGFLDTADRMV